MKLRVAYDNMYIYIHIYIYMYNIYIYMYVYMYIYKHGHFLHNFFKSAQTFLFSIQRNIDKAINYLFLHGVSS